MRCDEVVLICQDALEQPLVSLRPGFIRLYDLFESSSSEVPSAEAAYVLTLRNCIYDGWSLESVSFP